MNRTPLLLVLTTALTLAGCNAQPARPLKLSENATGNGAKSVTARASVERMKKDLHYLASDELEGRGPGTPGLDKAADYLESRFKSLGLKPVPGLKGYTQPFTLTTADRIDSRTTLVAGDKTYTLNKEFTAASFSAEKEFVGEAVFAGYCITSKDHQYDDFAGIDAKGKVVLALRYEPHDPARGKSRWGGDDWSINAHLETKARNAAQHGAVALILVNPPQFHDDALMPFSRQFAGGVPIPVLHVRQSVANELLARAELPKLEKIQSSIDKTVKPQSAAMKEVSLKGNVAIHRATQHLKNIVAMLPGAGPQADEYVIVGAHYDHLGWGGAGSLMNMPLLMRQPGVTEEKENGGTRPSTRPAENPHASPHATTQPAPTIPLPTTRAVHHGADDNGSGTTALLEMARLLAGRPAPARSIVFIAFSAEEVGLRGSGYFTNNPPIDLKKAVAMLNLDMVGRVRKNLLYIGGAGTAEPFDAILKKADESSPLEFKSFGRGGLGPSDHMSFALKKVPVLFFFTGTHADYHRPTDTADKINYEGMAQVVETGVQMILAMTTMPVSKYADAADRTSMMNPALVGERGSRRATLGIIPEYGNEEDGKGVKIGGATPGSPADKAGLRGGDVVVQLGERPTATLQELSGVLASHKPGDKVKLVYKRGEKTVTTEVTLGLRGGG